ncbi:MAG: hypothetical protein JSV86_09025 [Gemmatimonadota bacterium]|nr:MAG: hypothetical protein JSV86_09025 [Gemmatimonadota bacterium]
MGPTSSIRRRFARALASASLVAALTSPHAAAQDNGTGRLEFEITPYLWTLALVGDVTVNGQTIPVDASISDVAEWVDYAITAGLGLSVRKWTAHFDFMYLDASEDSADARLEFSKLALVATVG